MSGYARCTFFGSAEDGGLASPSMAGRLRSASGPAQACDGEDLESEELKTVSLDCPWIPTSIAVQHSFVRIPFMDYSCMVQLYSRTTEAALYHRQIAIDLNT